MKPYNFLQSLLLAFYSKSLYQDVGRNWRGLGLLYLLFLSAICAIPYTYGVYRHVIAPYVEALQPLIAEVPTITIQDGKVSIDQPEPYLIKDPEQGDRVVAIIDTTAEPNSLQETVAFALLSKKQIAIKQSGVVKIYEISAHKNAVYTPENVKSLSYRARYLITGLLYVLSTLVYALLGLIEALLYAGIIKFFVEVNFSYRALVRLAIVALTPVFLLAMVVHISGYYLPYRWLIYIPLSFAYLLYGMRSSWQKD